MKPNTIKRISIILFMNLFFIQIRMSMMFSMPHQSYSYFGHNRAYMELPYPIKRLWNRPTNQIHRKGTPFLRLSSHSEHSKGHPQPIIAPASQEFSSMKEWLIFSDLHVSPGTLETSLKVLDKVRDLAQSHAEGKCGVIFLGDFWHVRGALPVSLLNPVMAALSSWTMPVIMIPGNHDQVDYDGKVHALTPLQFAFPHPDKVNIISHPTLFLDALWLPYRRNVSISEQLLCDPSVRELTSGIFCHFDIQGALMNDGIESKNGVRCSAFPPDIPIYSGHYHKTHRIGGTSIQYVGSPYQTSINEAGQQKQLFVVNNGTWEVAHTLNVDEGKHFFRAHASTPLPEMHMLKQGDRLVWTVEDSSADEVKEKLELYQNLKVEVDLRELPKKKLSTRNTTVAQEGLSPESIYQRFVIHENEQRRNISEALEAKGLEVLRNMTRSVSLPMLKNVDLQIESLSLQRFGPFREKVIYPLCNRGLVLLRGENRDHGLMPESNASGKTSLAMAILWVLTGSIDHRPVSDGKVTDVVYDDGKKRNFVADVMLNGTLNGQSFTVRRRKGKKTTQLFVHHGGEELTKQTASETQAMLESPDGLGLRAPVVARALFHPQHSSQGLLQATDAKLKEELSYVVPMDVWQDATMLSRKLAKEAAQNVTKLEAQYVLREKDLELLESDWEREEQHLEDSIVQCENKLSNLNIKLQDIDSSLSTFNASRFEHKKTKIQSSILRAERRIIFFRETINKATQIEANESEYLVGKVAGLQTQMGFFSRLYQEDLKAHDEHAGELHMAKKQLKEQMPRNKDTSVQSLKIALQSAAKESKEISSSLSFAGASVKSHEKALQDFSLGVGDEGYECHSCGQSLSESAASLRKAHLERKLADAVRHLGQTEQLYDQLSVKVTQLQENLDAAERYSKLAEIVQLHEEKYAKSKSNLLQRQAEITKAQEELDLQNRNLQELKREREADLDSIITKMQKKELRLVQLRKDLSSTMKNIATHKAEHSRLLVLQQSFKNELKSVKKEMEIAQEKMEQKKRRKVNLQHDIKEISRCICQSLAEKESYEGLADQFGAKGIQNFIYVGVINQLQANAESFLEVLSDGDIQLSLSLEGDRIVKEALVRTSTGAFQKRSLSQLSGGQWQRASLALEFGFSELCSQRGLFKSNLLVLDEILTHLDAAGRHRVGKVLKYLVHGGKLELSDGTVIKLSERGVYSSLVLILQDLAAEELEEDLDYVDTVIKAFDSSYVVLDKNYR